CTSNTIIQLPQQHHYSASRKGIINNICCTLATKSPSLHISNINNSLHTCNMR
ncbi:unnamed protein product, partial [Prunus brigantina]